MSWVLLFFMISLSASCLWAAYSFALSARFARIKRQSRGAIRMDLLGSLICLVFTGVFGWAAVQIFEHMINI